MQSSHKTTTTSSSAKTTHRSQKQLLQVHTGLRGESRPSCTRMMPTIFVRMLHQRMQNITHKRTHCCLQHAFTYQHFPFDSQQRHQHTHTSRRLTLPMCRSQIGDQQQHASMNASFLQWRVRTATTSDSVVNTHISKSLLLLQSHLRQNLLQRRQNDSSSSNSQR